MPPDYAEFVAYSVLASGATLRYEHEAKRSKFIAVIGRVSSEGDARDFISAARQEFPDARHYCSAYLIGARREIQRSNDDGEPSGTAGAPMLEVLRSRSAAQAEQAHSRADLSDVCAVVVRYFGGTLLGTGGLIRAYSEATAGALNQARLRQRQEMSLFEIEVPHATAGRYRYELSQAGYLVSAIDYHDQARVEFAVLSESAGFSAVRALIDAVDRATASGPTEITTKGTRWADG